MEKRTALRGTPNGPAHAASAGSAVSTREHAGHLARAAGTHDAELFLRGVAAER